MSNHAKRRKTTGQINVGALIKQLRMRAQHKAHIEDLGHNFFAVVCTCGFDEIAPFGEEQATAMIDMHYAEYHVIPSPIGAKYRI
jgi:hypothetical protein